MTKTLAWLVGAGPGDPGLFTLRGREVLEQAEVVMHDALAHPAILDFCPGAVLENVGKRYGQPSSAQDEITSRLVAHALAGRRVVRLKGGDPFLFARGAEEAEALMAAGIPFEVVPGVSSPVGTSTFAGFSLTHREMSSSVAFVTGSDKAGKPWSPEGWRRLANATDTLCILMGLRRIDEIVSALIEGGRPPTTPAAVVQWGSRPQQRVVVAPLSELSAVARGAGLGSPGLIVIGEVVTLREKLRWYDNRPLFGKRLLLPRPEHQARTSAEAIRRRGAEPVVLPAIELHPPPNPELLHAAVGSLGDYDWVIFTSANGVSRTLQALNARGLDARAFGRSRIAAIGPRTAEALHAGGLRADFIAEQFVAESLAQGLLSVEPAPKQVLLLRAMVAREVLPEMLRAQGVTVDVVPAYRTEMVNPAGAEALRDAVLKRQVDAVLFTSSSMVTALCSALGPRAAELLAPLTLASIGPVTSRTALDLGLSVSVEADQYTIEGLLDRLEAHFA